MTFEQWLQVGVENGFCSESFCNTHDGSPTGEKEERLWEEGYDPCVHMVRLGNLAIWEQDAQDYAQADVH